MDPTLFINGLIFDGHSPDLVADRQLRVKEDTEVTRVSPVGGHRFDVATAAITPDTAPAGTDDTPGAEEFLVRGTLSFDPTDSFTATFSAAFTSSEFENSGANYLIYRCPGGVSQANGTPCGRKFRISQNRFPQAARSLPFAREDNLVRPLLCLLIIADKDNIRPRIEYAERGIPARHGHHRHLHRPL